MMPYRFTEVIDRFKEMKQAKRMERIMRKRQAFEEFKQKFLQEALEAEIKKKQKLQDKAKMVLDKAYSTVEKLIPDETKRKEFMSSYVEC